MRLARQRCRASGHGADRGAGLSLQRDVLARVDGIGGNAGQQRIQVDRAASGRPHRGSSQGPGLRGSCPASRRGRRPACREGSSSATFSSRRRNRVTRRLQIVGDRAEHLGALLDVAANARLHHVEGGGRMTHLGWAVLRQRRPVDVAAERGGRSREAVERTRRHARDAVGEQAQAKRKHDRVQQPARRTRPRPAEIGLRCAGPGAAACRRAASAK